MPLTLTVTSFQRLSPDQDSTRVLRDGSLTIGRGSEADWTLPDPERQISKIHCRIDTADGNYVLTDTSTNGVFINDRRAPIGRDNAVTLEPGDQVRLGDYEIEVAIGEGAEAAAESANQDSTAGPGPALEDPFPDPLLAGTAPPDAGAPDQSLADVPTPGYLDEPALFELDRDDQAQPVEQPRLLGVPDSPEEHDPGPPGAAPDHLPGDKAFFQTPNLVTDSAPPVRPPPGDGLLSAGSQTGGAIPDDWDAEGPDESPDLSAEAPAPPGRSPPAAETIPDDWSFEAEGSGGLPAPPAIAQIPDDWESAADEPEAPAAPATDPDLPPDSPLDSPTGVLLGASSRAPETTIPDGPLTDGAGMPEAVAGQIESTLLETPPAAPGAPDQDPTPATIGHPPPVTAAPSPSSGASATRALQAFLSGAQLEVPAMSDREAEELLRTLGQVYRIIVQGMMEVLAARASLKNEFRVEQTMIQPVQNNPLKFSLNVDNAMENLLTKRGKGYMSPIEAMQEGFGDLQAHQIATLAGMQSALQSILVRFDPDELEQRLESSSVLESILPGKRKARYWDTFHQLYRDIAREAEDDFQKLFGQAFAEAYETEIKKR